ncbi:MAG TPA: hypothetical protein VGO60_01600 [Iamia sp.]|nr:hypothetical protein [Iamia sp.]
MPAPAATCVWRLRPALLTALHQRFGAPSDTYGNGSQTWLRSDGPDGTPVEWRLHPRADFVRPNDVTADQLFVLVAGAVARGEEPPLDPAGVWTGLEAAWAFAEELAADQLAGCTRAALGLDADACGAVDRDAIGIEWERSGGRLDVVAHLLGALDALPSEG